MSTPNQPWPPGQQPQQPWGTPPGQPWGASPGQAWGQAPQPGWSPAAGAPPGGRRSPVLPVLGLAVAVVALLSSVLPYYRIEVSDENSLEYTGWQQRFTGPDIGNDSVFLAHGLALLLACGVLVAGAIVLLASRARPLGAALLATGAGMVACYTFFVLADAVNTAVQDSDRSSVTAGGWLLVLVGLASVAVLVLALRAVSTAARS